MPFLAFYGTLPDWAKNLVWSLLALVLVAIVIFGARGCACISQSMNQQDTGHAKDLKDLPTKQDFQENRLPEGKK